MSGHNKWSSIKHKKGKEDAKRGKIFTKINREITVATREGGKDPESNPRLKRAIQLAKANNMPNDTMKKAIMKGSGELPGAAYESGTYEGYGAGGVAVFLEVLTDNKNRTVAEVRHIFSKNNGNLGENGCVGWMFEQKGMFKIPKSSISEEEIFDKAIEAGADDVNTEEDDENYVIYTEVVDFNAVSTALDESGLEVSEAVLTRVPQNMVEVSDEAIAKSVLKMMDMLEDNDDVQQVYANFDIADELIEKLS